MESTKTRLEVELEDARKNSGREADQRESAESARIRIQREVAELREKLDEEIIIRTNTERYILSFITHFILVHFIILFFSLFFILYFIF